MAISECSTECFWSGELGMKRGLYGSEGVWARFLWGVGLGSNFLGRLC